MRVRGVIAVVAAVGLVVVPAAIPAAATQLRGTAGPGFSITLQNEAGTIVSRLDPGTYDIAVRDLSIDHNFHLYGPGVEEATSVDAIEDKNWTVTFSEGRYTYVCDLHPTQMVRELVVGNPPAATPKPTPTPKPAPKLLATVGPKATISLRSASGAPIKSVKAGTYSIVVRDRSKAHNFHLVGVGVNKKSSVAAVGTTTWKLKLSKGALRFYSDKAPTTVKGSIKVV
jgi:hypothetical protein